MSFSHISFQYPGGPRALHDISFCAGPECVTAVAGPTGSGKTTLMNLLLGFYRCDRGRILLNGRDIYELTLRELRKSCGAVMQDSWVFSGTIYENISYGREQVSREEVEEAAGKAQLHDYIQGLPEGYDTMVGEKGLSLSKGQRQMVAIARALLSEARVLIFDEATSDVDTRTEKQIQAALEHLTAGKTCVMIAHRLAAVRNAGQIIVLEQGQIVQRGSHDQLMREEGLYRQMYDAQFGRGAYENI